MAKQELKFVLGKVVAGMPADICFYDDVDYWSVDNFLWEFDWLVNQSPSIIRVHINSAGGSCVDGISIFTKIIDCKIKTQCIVDGIAASMASIIWAAGSEVFMKDYALLMIHNPFIDNDGEKEKNQITDAFTAQLKTIYSKRFGFDDEKIEAIMNGEPGNDGTFFTAAQAVENGFLPSENVIETPALERKQIEAALKGVNDMVKIKAVMDLAVTKPQTKESKAPAAQIDQDTNNNNSLNSQKMKENFTVIAALLDMTSETATVESVTASIKALQAKAKEHDILKAKFDELKKASDSMKVELEASKASVTNLTTDLEKANADLKQYKDAEKAAFEAKVESLVEAAVNDCKISKDDKAAWIEMAKNNFDVTKKALDGIKGRDNLSQQAGVEDPNKVKDDMLTEEQKVQAKVDEVVGEKFEFRTLG